MHGLRGISHKLNENNLCIPTIEYIVSAHGGKLRTLDLVRVPDNFEVKFYCHDGEVLLHGTAWLIYIPLRRGGLPQARLAQRYQGGEMVPNYFCWYEHNPRLHNRDWYERQFGDACGIFTVGPNSRPIINLRERNMIRIRELFDLLNNPEQRVVIHWAACREH